MKRFLVAILIFGLAINAANAGCGSKSTEKGAVAGAVVGAVLLGPGGMLLGGTLGAAFGSSDIPKGSSILTSPGRKDVCEWVWKFPFGSYQWVDKSAWCENQNFNPNMHEAVVAGGGKCWRAECMIGAKQWGNLLNCVPCNGANEKKQGDVCYTIDDPNCASPGPDSPYVIYANPDKPNDAPRCIPVCDVQVAAASFDVSDSTQLIFKIHKQAATTVGTRSE